MMCVVSCRVGKMKLHEIKTLYLDRAANRCAEGSTLTDLGATVGTYKLRSYGGEQSRSYCYAAKPLVKV